MLLILLSPCTYGFEGHFDCVGSLLRFMMGLLHDGILNVLEDRCASRDQLGRALLALTFVYHLTLLV